MGKAKKRKVEDFHKPKLKVGKKKPVGTNVTNTSFQTSSINIAKQLEETNEAKTNRNLTIKVFVIIRELIFKKNYYFPKRNFNFKRSTIIFNFN